MHLKSVFVCLGGAVELCMNACCGLQVMWLTSVSNIFNFCFELHQRQNLGICKIEGGVGLLIVVLPRITCGGGPDNK